MAQAGHAAAFSGRTPNRALSPARLASALGRAASVVLTMLVLWGLWELVRWVWIREAWTWPFPVNDTTMPHIHTIFQALGEPAPPQGPLLISAPLPAAWFTAKEARVGVALGATFGFVLAVAL